MYQDCDPQAPNYNPAAVMAERRRRARPATAEELAKADMALVVKPAWLIKLEAFEQTGVC